MSPRLFIPPAAAKELQEESRKHKAEVMDSLETDATIERFDRELKAIDHRLHLVKARDWVKAGTALRPGFWHVVRDNESAPPSVITIEDKDGEYVYPNSSIFDLLRKNDLWNRDVRRDRKRKEAELEERERKMKQAERKERQEEIYERYKAGTQTRISMNRDQPWTQSVKGTRGKKRG